MRHSVAGGGARAKDAEGSAEFWAVRELQCFGAMRARVGAAFAGAAVFIFASVAPPAHADPPAVHDNDVTFGLDVTSTTFSNAPLTLRGPGVPPDLVGVKLPTGQSLSFIGGGLSVTGAGRLGRSRTRFSGVVGLGARFSESVSHVSGAATTEEEPLALHSDALHYLELDFARLGLRYDAADVLLQIDGGVGYGRVWGAIDVGGSREPNEHLAFGSGGVNLQGEARVCVPWQRSASEAGRPFVRLACLDLGVVDLEPTPAISGAGIGNERRVGFGYSLGLGAS